jgi:hypothetical protein
MRMLGTGDACPRMRREKVEARSKSFMVDSSNDIYGPRSAVAKND